MKRRLPAMVAACVLGASLVLGGCGGETSPVHGSATPVPGTDVPATDSTTNTSPTPPPSPVVANASSRFLSVAPATTDTPKYTISPAINYDLGILMASPQQTIQIVDSHRQPIKDQNGNTVTVTTNGVLPIPVRGWLRYPVAATSSGSTNARYPVIVLLHGNHDATDPSYQGYDYLATDLAQQGYVVLSLDANTINGYANSAPDQGDPSSESRAQLMLGTLDRLREIDANGGPGVLRALRGKLDFDRVGIMGHSRGGQAVAYAIKYNLTRKGVTQDNLVRAVRRFPGLFSSFPDLVSAIGAAGTAVNERALIGAMFEYNMFYAAGGETTPPYNIRGAFMLAPTDFSLAVGLSNVPLVGLSASCDGDVLMMDGAHAFDTNRFGTQYDTAPRYQIVVNGGNHDYFNTIWTADDAAYSNLAADTQDYCSPTRASSVRLSADDQRRVGMFLVDSFMRYFVGDEAQFAAYWNGTAQLPPAACPGGTGTCDERAVLSIQKNGSQSKLLQRFLTSESALSNLLGGALTFTGFDELSICQTPYAPAVWYQSPCSPFSAPDFIDSRVSPNTGYHGGGLVSISDNARLIWSAPNATISTDLKGVSAAGFDSLTFRVAVVRPVGQEVVVTLTDTKGNHASVNGSDYSDALYLVPKAKGAARPLVDDPQDAVYADGRIPEFMSMVAIPLAAFKGVDITSLAKVDFTMPKASGMMSFADLELQNFSRPAQ